MLACDRYTGPGVDCVGECLPPSLPLLGDQDGPTPYQILLFNRVVSWDFNGEVPVLALEELTLFSSEDMSKCLPYIMMLIKSWTENGKQWLG